MNDLKERLMSAIRRYCPEDNIREDYPGRVATPLIAGMRCFVVSKLGDEVEIPEELT